MKVQGMVKKSSSCGPRLAFESFCNSDTNRKNVTEKPDENFCQQFYCLSENYFFILLATALISPGWFESADVAPGSKFSDTKFCCAFLSFSCNRQQAHSLMSALTHTQTFMLATSHNHKFETWAPPSLINDMNVLSFLLKYWPHTHKHCLSCSLITTTCDRAPTHARTGTKRKHCVLCSFSLSFLTHLCTFTKSLHYLILSHFYSIFLIWFKVRSTKGKLYFWTIKWPLQGWKGDREKFQGVYSFSDDTKRQK